MTYVASRRSCAWIGGQPGRDEAKYLNTPRLVADATGTTVWRWDQQEPFGNNPADEDPDANSVAFDLPLRLPGQRYDKETNLHYNYFRDYDPSLGRYGESDPIGLRGGVNTYASVHGSPLILVDIRGDQSRLPFIDTLQELLSEFFIEETAKNAPQPGTYGGMIGKLICDNTKGQITSSYQTCMAGVGNIEGCSLFQVAGVGAIQKCIDGCRNAIRKCNPKCPP